MKNRYMKELKYQEKIKQLDCNLSGFSEKKHIEVFRWVFENCDENSFLPVYYYNHNREQNEKNCRGWALSFFNTQTNAKRRLLQIAMHKKKIFKKLGTHIAKGSIVENDGISNNPNDNGHFDLFEYKGVNLSNKFTIVEIVYNGSN